MHLTYFRPTETIYMLLPDVVRRCKTFFLCAHEQYFMVSFYFDYYLLHYHDCLPLLCIWHDSQHNCLRVGFNDCICQMVITMKLAIIQAWTLPLIV